MGNIAGLLFSLLARFWGKSWLPLNSQSCWEAGQANPSLPIGSSRRRSGKMRGQRAKRDLGFKGRLLNVSLFPLTAGPWSPWGQDGSTFICTSLFLSTCINIRQKAVKHITVHVHTVTSSHTFTWLHVHTNMHTHSHYHMCTPAFLSQDPTHHTSTPHRVLPHPPCAWYAYSGCSVRSDFSDETLSWGPACLRSLLVKSYHQLLVDV